MALNESVVQSNEFASDRGEQAQSAGEVDYEIVEYIPEAEGVPDYERERRERINDVLNAHRVIGDQEIFDIAANKFRNDMTRDESLRRGLNPVTGESFSKPLERLTSLDWKEKAKKWGGKALKWGYWGAISYGLFTGTSPLDVLKSVPEIPGKIGDILSVPGDVVSKVGKALGIEGAVEPVAAGGGEQGPQPLDLHNSHSGALFDVPKEISVSGLEDVVKPQKYEGGLFYRLTSSIFGKKAGVDITRAVGRPFAGVLGENVAKHTEYPVKGKWLPFVALPGVWWLDQKLGVSSFVSSKFGHILEEDPVRKLSKEEQRALRGSAREAVLSGDWQRYDELQLAIANLDQKYDALKRVAREQQQELLQAV